MKLGECGSKEEIGKRDAVHVSTVMVRGYGPFSPGSPVRFINNNFDEVELVRDEHADYKHGIVDPFIKECDLNYGEPFLVILCPGLTANLVHHFDLKLEEFPEPEDGYWGDSECRFCG